MISLSFSLNTSEFFFLNRPLYLIKSSETIGSLGPIYAESLSVVYSTRTRKMAVNDVVPTIDYY